MAKLLRVGICKNTRDLQIARDKCSPSMNVDSPLWHRGEAALARELATSVLFWTCRAVQPADDGYVDWDDAVDDSHQDDLDDERDEDGGTNIFETNKLILTPGGCSVLALKGCYIRIHLNNQIFVLILFKKKFFMFAITIKRMGEVVFLDREKFYKIFFL